MKLLLNDFINNINDKDKKYRFIKFIKFKGYSSPNTDIIDFYNMILKDPTWFKNLNNNSFKSLNTKKNTVSCLKTIWDMEIIKNNIVDNDLYLEIKKQLINFYNEVVKDQSKSDISLIKEKIKDLENYITDTQLVLKNKLNEINKIIDETIYNI